MASESWFASGERVAVAFEGGVFEVFCRTAGSGPLLTFLHGFPTSSWDWAGVVAALEPRFRCLCFDFLGFGDSDKPRRHRYSLHEQADLTEALWSSLDVRETGLVAHDYGATVAQELIARHDEGALGVRLSRAVLLNAAVYVELARPLLVQRLLVGPAGPLVACVVNERVFASSFSSVFSETHPVGEEEVREHWRVLERRGGTAPVSHLLSRYMADRKRHAARWEAALERATVPLHFVWGMADPRSGARIAERIRERIPGATLAELAGVGHYPQLEVPDLVARQIAAVAHARSSS